MKVVGKILDLKDRKWQEFVFEDVFVIKRGEQGVYKQDMKAGKFPYVSASASNNGVSGYIEKYNRESNLISLAYDGSIGSTFYQSSRWFASEKVVSIGLKNYELNRYIALFLCPLIKSQKIKYGYAYKWSVETRMTRGKLLLPINIAGNPDWQFMEDYCRECENQLVKKYIDCVAKVADDIKIDCVIGDDLPSFSEKKWLEFDIVRFFTPERGRENNMSALTSGDIPLISAKKIDNGLKAFVSIPPERLHLGHAITLNNDGDGGAGLAYYQPFRFALDTHVTALVPKIQLSQCTLLFICAAIAKQRERYGHGHSISNTRLKKIKIMLPAKSDDSPDWEYMELYVKNIICHQVQVYAKLSAGTGGASK